ncbi:uncharacterized protein BP5553_05766 [Venustampulla echinocandica]|uniref:Uncharacterized protein n=1 Tax=Venustampulla echinocandica TaxID=2656787 RepID=A0A370TLL7_9HELO|nr:uncharacterized protein BP5553_05766 [Venustampulla echinocandica]RDL36414.1 hypothetical protein BP5553_05766 [Venustampulla echinocandica]
MYTPQNDNLLWKHSPEIDMLSQDNAASQAAAPTSKFNPTTLHEAMDGLEGPSIGLDVSSNFEDEEIIRQNEEARARQEKARQEITIEALEAFGIHINAFMGPSLDHEMQGDISNQSSQKSSRTIINVRKDFFLDLGNFPELNVELAKHLQLNDFVSLYAISNDFHCAVNSQLTSVMVNLSHRLAPESAEIFRFTFYDDLCTTDPMKHPHPVIPSAIRRVPSIRWLRMVIHRDKAVRDILACMARQGHRMPQGMSMTLKKMWLLMDISTNRHRVQFMHGKSWTDSDLYNVQMFVVKLDMRFNDPIDGPGTDHMRKLFLGQRGLSPLCKLLKRTGFTTTEDILKLAVKYSHQVRPEHKGYSIWGVPPQDIGTGHLEGWGKGNTHLMRPDELVMRESVRRGLGLKQHIMNMMLWGYIDPVTTQNTPATAEEKYMSDDEEVPIDPDWNDYEDPNTDQDMADAAG